MDDVSPWVPKHAPRPGGQHLCSYTPTGRETDYCNQAATWHVMWDGQLDNSFTCNTHMELIQSRWVYDDRHPVVADCGMPGSLWMYKLNCCQFPNTPAQAGAKREDATV